MTGAPFKPVVGLSGNPLLSTGHALLATGLDVHGHHTLYTHRPRFVESHSSQQRAWMGHPSFVTDPAV